MQTINRQTTIVHLVPTWKLKPGTTTNALCGAAIDVPDTKGHAGIGIPPQNAEGVVCALCELCRTFGDIPEPPESGHMEQGALW